MSEEMAATPLQKRMARSLARPGLLTVAVLLLLYFLSGLRVIKPDEQALVLRFGGKTTLPLLPGTHYTLPHPIDRIYLYKPSEVKSILVGASDLLPRPEGVRSASYQGTNVGPEFLAGDENIIELELNIQYQISEPAGYLFRAVNADRLVVLACETALTTELAQTPVDDILTSGRQVLLARVKTVAQETLTRIEAGLTIIAVNLAKTSPPMQVADAFKDVASALEDRDRLISEANGQYSQAIPQARGEAIRIVQEALADSNGTIRRAQGEAERFVKTLDELQKGTNAELAILRLYLESMEQLMPKMRKYVIDTSRIPKLQRDSRR